MATGALVPFEVRPGVTVMMPDYLVDQQKRASGGMTLPEAPKPAADPNRLASGYGSQGGPAPILSQLSPDFRQLQDFGNSNPAAQPGTSPLAMTVAPPSEDAERRRKRQDAEKATAAAKEAASGKKNAKNLKPVPKPDPRRESNVIADTASTLYGKKSGGGAAPAKVDPQNLQPVVAEVKQERTPGMRLLPEQEWRLGLSERPKELYELDPTVDQPTWGTEDPVMREKLTPLERGAEATGQFARQDFERAVEAEQEMGIAKRQMLAEQSQLIDSHLSTIAERRNKIAKLQETADRRMQEAESFEPRTKSEIWESKGALAHVMGFIAMALGGYTQGLGRNGGKNPGWDMINKALDDEVEGERDRAERRYKVGQAARNDVERAQALYGDLDMSMLEAKNRKLASVMSMTQQNLADRTLDETAKQRAAQIYEAAKEQFFANKQQLFDQIAGKVTKEEATLRPYGEVLQKATPKPTGGGGGGPAGISGDKLKGLSAEVRSLAVKMPDGTYRFARSPQDRIPMQAKLNNAGEMVRNLRQLQRLRSDKSNTIPWSEKRGQIEAIGANLLALGKAKDQMGTLDKGLLEFSAKRYGAPEEFNIVDNTIDGKLAENIRLLEGEVRKVGEYDLDNGPFELTEGGVSEDILHD